MSFATRITAGILAGALTVVAAPALAGDGVKDTTEVQSADQAARVAEKAAEHAARKAARVARIAEALGMTPEAYLAAVENVREEMKATFGDDLTREERRAAFKAAFSAETGIPVETLEEVHAQLKAERKAEKLAALRVWLDKKVAAGKMTQEQADAKYARAEAGDYWFGRGHRKGHHKDKGDAEVRGDGESRRDKSSWDRRDRDHRRGDRDGHRRGDGRRGGRR